MGCWKVGAALAPVNHRLAAEELQVEMARLQLRGAVVEESPEWTGLMQRWVPGATIPLRSPDPSPATRARGIPTSGESIGLILSTGGSTGPPKSAMLSVRAILSNALNTASSWDLRPDDVGLPLFPFFHTGGWNVLLLPLLAVGATSVVLERAEPGAVLAEIPRTKATILSAVPTTLSDLVRLPGFEETDLGSLRVAKSGGGLTPEPVVRQFRQRGIAFYQGYGLTEAGPNLFYSAPEDLDRPGSVGRPTPLAELVLRNERGDTDTEGELWVRGPLTFSGYLGDPAATEAAMVDGWVATGDLLRRDVDGFHYFVGRRKQMIKSGGENVYPTEIESVLESHPAVAEAAVIGVPDERWGESGCAFVRTITSVEDAELEEFLRGHLARFKIPRRFVRVEQIPRTPAGKKDYPRLRRSVNP
jgi:fatty-acyl-CoA synthase